MTKISQRGYVNPEVLISTEELADSLSDSNIRIIESNEDQLLYSSGHIPGAIEIDWVRDLNQSIVRDYLIKEDFQKLLTKNGISKDTPVVFYGDKSNWWACYAFWIFQLFGHKNARILDGGRLKWVNEERGLTKERPTYAVCNYIAQDRDDKTLRAMRDDVLCHLKNSGKLIDVRSPEEYNGTRLHMEGYPNEGALRGGHIPTAKNVPWAKAVNLIDGTFKTAQELRDIYENMAGLYPTDEVIAYCRIGERSSLSWFVLKYLLGYEKVKNYDGSWTEWGNLVGAPIER